MPGLGAYRHTYPSNLKNGVRKSHYAVLARELRDEARMLKEQNELGAVHGAELSILGDKGSHESADGPEA